MQVIDTATATTPVNFSLNNPTLPAAVETFIDFFPVPAGATPLTLPAATIWVLGIRNLGGINGTPAGNVTVQVQVTGGALNTAANSEVIAPGGVKLFWNQTEAANGIIAVSVSASVANTPIAILMAA